MIPCKITPLGDKDYAKNFIGAARSQLRILKNALSFQKLEQGVRRVQLGPRIFIEAIVCFNLSEVKIFCPFVGGEKKARDIWECFCCCCWAMGFIVGYTDEEHLCNDEEYEAEGCSDPETRYDVRVCRGDRYSLFQGCIPTDFAHYRIGEQVFVMVANSNTDINGYTRREEQCPAPSHRWHIIDLFTIKNMVPSMVFSFDEYKTSAEKNDFEKCEECERKQECKDETIQDCKIITDDETEESDTACMTETITLIPKDGYDKIIEASRNCEGYQFETGSARGVSSIAGIPPFYIVPIGCKKELGKWL